VPAIVVGRVDCTAIRASLSASQGAGPPRGSSRAYTRSRGQNWPPVMAQQDRARAWSPKIWACKFFGHQNVGDAG
jgi:hypothetical protein